MTRKKKTETDDTQTSDGAEPRTRELAERIIAYVSSSLVGGSISGDDLKASLKQYEEAEINAALNDLHARQLFTFDQKAKVYRVVEKGEKSAAKDEATAAAREDIDTAKDVIVDYMKIDGEARPTLAVVCDDLGNCAGLREAMRELVTEGRVVKHKTGKGKEAVITYELLAVADQPDEDPADAPGPDDGGAPIDGISASMSADGVPTITVEHTNGGSNGAAGDSFHPTRYIEHVLTEDEILTMRLEVEQHHKEIDELQEELTKLSDRCKSLKKRIDTNSEDALSLSRRVRAGKEHREIECEERRELDQRPGEPTYGKQVVVTYRLDTYEPIEWRELTRAERQGSLFDPAAPTPPVNEFRGATLS